MYETHIQARVPRRKLGATWVHWFQPHMWAENSRYNQAVYPSPETASSLMAKQWAALSDGQLFLLDAQTLCYKLHNGMRGIYSRIAEDLRCPIRLETPPSPALSTPLPARKSP